jgi:diguanylate cyclase (GGDEF)-like protein/PAS domain S-box-containing protein
MGIQSEFVLPAGAAASPPPGDELQLLRAAMDAASDPVYVVDAAAMRFLYVNEAACRILGIDRAAHLTMPPWQVSGITCEQLQAIYRDVIARSGETVSVEVFGINAQDQRKGWFEVQRRALRFGERWLIVTNSREVTERKLAEESALRHARLYAALSATNEAILRAGTVDELYRQVCEAAVHGGKLVAASVLVPDPESEWMRVAATAGAIDLRKARISWHAESPFGCGLVGTAFRSGTSSVSNDFLADERMGAWRDVARRSGIKAGAAVPFSRGGKTCGVLLLYANRRRVFDEEAVLLVERMAQNIAFALDNTDRDTARREAEARAKYLAAHDALTGLPNRIMFSELLIHAIGRARRGQHSLALLFIDLDRFKVINDSLGHHAGDSLLVKVAERLKQSVRAADVVARLGGDEFVVLLPDGADERAARNVACKLLGALADPIALEGEECRVTASIGISVFPEDGENESSLMKNADIAMYAAKDEGKNTFQFFSAARQSRSVGSLALEGQLRGALDRGEFFLHYQPRKDLRTGRITGVEALLRWRNPALGLVPPADFIPLAEETGLIVPIGQFVLCEACSQAAAWLSEGLAPLQMAVNLSTRQLGDPELPAQISAILSGTGLAPGQLELEITESMVMDRPERTVALLNRIREMGVRLAIDDFGTGYSSLAQLRRLPIDALKIDRSFVCNLPDDDGDKAIAEAIIAMARKLRLTVIAEGVETQAQEAFLSAQDCDEIQGYHVQRPALPEVIGQLLRSRGDA